MSVNGLEKLTTIRNKLQEKIYKSNVEDQNNIPILLQIDTWELKTIKKVQQAADDVRNEVLALILSKHEEIRNQFQTFSKDLDNLREANTVLDQDIIKLEREVAQINDNLKKSFQLATVKLMTNQTEQIAWNQMISIEQKPENVTSQHEQQSKLLETQEFAAPGTFLELYCQGRHCAQCGKCRDWYFTGDSDTWAWIRNCKHWTDTDANRWRNNRVYEQFDSRDGETCIFNHGFGLPGLPPGPNLDHRLFALHICLCEDNIKSNN